MSYKLKQYQLSRKIKAFKFLIDELGYSMKEAQRLIDRKKVIVNGNILVKKSAYIKGKIEIIEFNPKTNNIKPIFQTSEFAIFDKPTGILVHPTGKDSSYSMTHEVKYLFGTDANITHRIDKETSGILLAAKNSKSQRSLKISFENREIKKGYLAFVKGKISDKILIDEPIKKNHDFSEIKLKVNIHKDGKSSQTIIIPKHYYPKLNVTLIEALPLTGRQHQIRIHLFHVKHPIVGDPLYGTEVKVASDYLDGLLSKKDRIKFTGAARLMLHANWINFNYKNEYKIYSKQNFENLITQNGFDNTVQSNNSYNS